ncbi:helix-turn-helix transcriptional regulator [Catenulispora rubra]|uniref:helix-turn-helix transcriptional regulator n=1 Tax=Catenulispora rubra TaxID=280293 RepID=UPI0018922D09|nr:helix-turn-helix transcriptional regulator [Catenulispora rubra]
MLASAPGALAGPTHSPAHRLGVTTEEASHCVPAISPSSINRPSGTPQPSRRRRPRLVPGSPGALLIDGAAELTYARIVADLKRARKDAGLSRNALSSPLPVRGRAISEWETRVEEPTLQHLIQWSRALDYRLAIVSQSGLLRQEITRPRVGEGRESFEQRRLTRPLRNRRVALGLSQAGLGELVGVSRDSIQRWELCLVPPRSIALVVWAQKLGCSVVVRPVRESGLAWSSRDQTVW